MEILIIFWLMFFGIGLLGTLFWIWMLVDCALYEKDQGNTKIVWILIIVFTHFIGALLYLIFQRSKRKTPSEGTS
jgi:hypothetical protein